MLHELVWASGGPARSATEDYRWECTCGYRPAVNWPESELTWKKHQQENP